MMPTNMPFYLLEVNSCLVAFYLFYVLLLRKETGFKWNRLYITGAVLLSLILPILDIAVSPEVSYLPKPDLPALTIFAADGEDNKQTSASATVVEKEAVFSPFQWLWMGYLTISVVLLGRLLWQVGRLLHFGYRHTQENHTHYRLVHTGGKLPTFSFFQMLFWDNSHSLSQTDQAFIFTHELAHIRQWHSADAMLLEVLKVVCWFNPVVYLLRKSLEEVHEYLADAAVTRHHDARQYSRVMAAQVFNQLHLSFAQSFNRSLINKRIAMIQTTNSPKPAFWKMALSFPLIALLFVIYSCRPGAESPVELAQKGHNALYRMGEVAVVGYGVRPVMKDVSEKFDKYNLPVPLNKLEEEAYEHLDEFPAPINGMDSFRNAIQASINPSNEPTISGTVYVQAIVDEEGTIQNPAILQGLSTTYDAQALKAVQNSPKWMPGKVNGKPVSARVVIPVTFGKHSSARTTFSDIQELPQTPTNGQPAPQEGMEAFYKYLMQNLRYPKEARSNLVEGKVLVGFTVKKDGTLANIQIEESLFPALDAEVMRVIQESKLVWKPAMENGQAIDSKIIVPFAFKLG